MALKAHIVIWMLFSIVVTLADDTAKTDLYPPQPTPTSTSSTPATTTKLTTMPTPTTKPTVPTTIPTVPTTKPTDPTTKPTDPTTKPTDPTTKPTDPTTTLPPTTKPTPTPTTTKPPTTPKPTPAPSDWVVHGENGSVCIVANMALKLTVPYKSSDNKSMNAEIDLAKIAGANATGNCTFGKDEQTLVLIWNNAASTFIFAQNTSDKVYSLKSIELKITVNNETFPNITKNETAKEITFRHDENIFSIPLNHSYTCGSLEPLHMNSTVSASNTTFVGTMTVSNAHVEAFKVGKETSYNAAMDCATVLTPDIVPIVVGLILAGLVVVVLVAYLIGRRRAQSRGYLSM